MKQPNEICSIEIRRGVIRLVSIEMQMTYGGLIEGAPTASFNDDLIEGLRKRHTPSYVVPPERTVHPQTTDLRDEPLETLPPVQCVGMFDGPPTPRAVGDWWRTFLYVIWFQEPSDQIVHPRAAARMHDMPWDDLARDLTFDDL
ncbi:hypothetical protein [Thermomonospora catenispora]|uniref:hypothetical protein n=1 Tax=Thermomonospora catenispora TaxID=2493090 RepID=UPI00111D85D8|nr:hypothetical protein [Thermomonospora catenispora]TNY36777.1 hypothetical protein EIO00_12025 [Thermomonospora catenispora]